MASQEYVKLAQSLPPRLLRFFARYPPPSESFANRATASSISTALNTSSSDPNASNDEATVSAEPPVLPYKNPFQSHKHPATRKWHDPVYSLRRQADLVKMARANGVEELLPYTVKGTEERIKKRQEQGLRVKGTGIGQRVKGKMWERTMKGRLEKRRQAMLGMPKLVQQWKQVIHNYTLYVAGAANVMLDGSRTRVEEMAQVTLFFISTDDHARSVQSFRGIARTAFRVWSHWSHSICALHFL